MKNLTESSEVFAAYVMIDMNIYFLKDLQKKIFGKDNRSPIEKMVDKATGFEKDNHLKNLNDCKICLESIIESKKIIEADYSNDLKALQELNELIKNITHKKHITKS